MHSTSTWGICVCLLNATSDTSKLSKKYEIYSPNYKFKLDINSIPVSQLMWNALLCKLRIGMIFGSKPRHSSQGNINHHRYNKTGVAPKLELFHQNFSSSNQRTLQMSLQGCKSNQLSHARGDDIPDKGNGSISNSNRFHLHLSNCWGYLLVF